MQLSVMLWSSGRRYFRRFVLSLAAPALLVLVVYVHRCVYFDLSATRHLGNGEYSTICRYTPWKDGNRSWPERITITTGASSREFLHLLNLLDSLAAFESSIRVVIWDLGLRPCQVAFLCKKLQLLQVLFVINEFRFTLYPLYFKSIKGIWKPVLIKEIVDEYGTALWIDPDQSLRKPLAHIYVVIENQGIVASCSVSSNHSAYNSRLVGFQKRAGTAYNILMKWYQSTLKIKHNLCRYSPAILTNLQASACGKETVDWSDFTLNQLMSQSGQGGSCLYLGSHLTKSHTMLAETGLQKSYLLDQSTICRRKSLCILSGNQSYPMGQPFVGSILRRNKMNYALAHGYHFIEGGKAYTERKHGGNSGPNWGKFDEVLKYLDECETLLCLDTDAIFTNFSIKVESFFDLPEAKGKDMFVVVPSSDGYLNAGVLLMQSTDNTRALLLASMDEQRWSTDWRFKESFEQSAMWELLRPVHSPWRNVVHLSMNDRTLQGLCGFTGVKFTLYGYCFWKPGDFIAHFAPPYVPAGHIARFIEEHLDLIHANDRVDNT